MDDGQPFDGVDFEDLMRALATPTTPVHAIEFAPNLTQALAPLDLFEAVKTFAGMQTDAAFHGNSVRLDWAVRFVLGTSRGRAKVTQGAVGRFLNERLEEARVLRLEDPIEDFFVESVPSPYGELRLFTGCWEKAGTHTDCLLRACKRVDDDPQNSPAIHSALAILRLSEALVARTGYDRFHVGTDLAQESIKIPSEVKLRSLSRRVFFSFRDLSELGFEPSDLSPYILRLSEEPTLLNAIPGNSVLERKPLLATPTGLIVAAPANLSTAARAVLIDSALHQQKGPALRRALLDVHAKVINDSGLVRMQGRAPPASSGAEPVRDFIWSPSDGRYVHVVQTVASFDDWPADAFGSTVEDRVLSAAISKRIKAARAFIENLPDFRAAITLLFVGGWGRGFAFDLNDGGALDGWLIVPLEPVDAVVLSGCRDGSVSDLWRLSELVRLVEEQGFQFQNLNGLLNIFHWWRRTDHTLIPERWTDFEPPAQLAIESNALLEARREGLTAIDQCAPLHPNGHYVSVCRLEPKTVSGSLDPIYGSLDKIGTGTLLGVVLQHGQAWWVELQYSKPADMSGDFETWKAALKWLRLTMAAFLDRCGDNVQSEPLLLRLVVHWPDRRREKEVDEIDISSTVAMSVGEDGVPVVSLQPEWQVALHRPRNDAEVLLATRFLQAIAETWNVEISEVEMTALVRRAAGSDDYRWRHAFDAKTVIDELVSDGLVDSFRAISESAGALAKCGKVWRTHERSLGLTVEGRDECIAFLSAHADDLLVQLRTEVAKFERRSLVIAALRSFQAALGEQRSWRATARALRAIYGVEGDFRASLERAYAANAVSKAANMLVELALCEASLGQGLSVGKMDLDELQALALLHFNAADTLAALHGDQIPTRIQISPTGDVLYDHRFEEATLKVSAELRHGRERVQASDEYLERSSDSEDEPQELAPDLGSALHAEYGIDADGLFDLPFAAARVAEQEESGVFVMKRSELIDRLSKFPPTEGKDLSPAVDRLTLSPRPNWGTFPEGASRTDFDFAKFDRKYSLTGRPLVALDWDDDPELVVAPAIIHRTVLHNLGGAWSGSLQNEFWRSRSMQAYASKRGDITGLAFNDRVASKVRELGMDAWASAKPSWCLNQKATEEVKQLGDIDVLAVNADRSVVWVLEVKDLKLCRTRGEAARRLSEYRGRCGAKGKPDKLLRHLRRVEYLRTNAAGLVQRLMLPNVPRVCGAVIMRSPQPMQQLTACSDADACVLMLDELESIPWGSGWEKQSTATQVHSMELG